MSIQSKRGSILILSLWILAILVLLSIGLGYSVSLDQKLVSYQRDRLMALYLAKAGCLAAVAELEQDPTPNVDALADQWFHDPEAFKEVTLGEGSYTVRAQVQGEDGHPEILYGVIDEDRKINLNIASKKIIMRLPGMTEETADSILDWRDEDPYPHLLGAEDFYYQGLDPAYKAKNAPFEALEELLLVRGLKEEDFWALEPFVTLYTDGKVNLNTAPREVLIALGMGEGLAEKLSHFRKGPDGLSFTRDDQIFESLGSVEQQLNASAPLTLQEAAQLTNLISQGLMKVKSEIFRIEAQGMDRTGKIVRSVEAIVRRELKTASGTATPTVFLYWHQD